MMEIKKFKSAVLPIAGFGTQSLPATKAMPKEWSLIVAKQLV